MPEITKELERLKKGGRKEDATPEIRKLVKQLTGYEYDQCFGNNNVGFKFENKAGAF